MSLVICHWSFVIGYLLFIIGHSSTVIISFSLATLLLPFCLFGLGFYRFKQ
ncbi:hypothetical protein [Coleofasciculus sp. F4-SAH-05]|uniref:hypothetical protein n=1 Tax=Coleofasciculus sp. F4-SAH-05 TaxID=3069525 RepID=UPI0032FC1549